MDNNLNNKISEDGSVINEPSILDEKSLADKIYLIRGEKVMLDFELAEIYGYTTKAFNQQVKNNIDKFDEDFRFRLIKSEYDNLRSKNLTSSPQWGGKRYMPFAFTESGIYMLMTVLRGELAIKQSKALIRTFKAMKDYIIENQSIISSKDLLSLSLQTNQNTKDIIEIKEKMATKEDLQKVMENFIDPSTYKHFLIMDGQKIEADIAYSKIYKLASESVYVVDNYISLKTLELLREVKAGVKIKIFSDNKRNRNMLTSSVLNDFRKDYPDVDIEIKMTGGKYHDRYIAIDYNTRKEIIYHCGASSKDAGSKITTISKIEDTKIYHPLFDELLDNAKLDI